MFVREHAGVSELRIDPSVECLIRGGPCGCDLANGDRAPGLLERKPSRCASGGRNTVDIATGASASTTAISNKLDSALSQGKKNSSVSAASNQPTVATGTEKSFADANRRALEQSAGQNAATLSLKSLPVKAVVRINGKPLGRDATPGVIGARHLTRSKMEGPRWILESSSLTYVQRRSAKSSCDLSAAPRTPGYVQLE